MSHLTQRVKAWRWRGADADVLGQRIRVWHRGGTRPLLLFLHGFPSSSYDWRHVWELTEGHASLTFDFLGFGLSAKPRDHDYSLLFQADLAEELVARHAPGAPVYVIAHDMGTTVANELMARDIEKSLSFDLAGVMLFNGSMVQGAAKPVLTQKLLRGPLGPVAARLSSQRLFRQQFGSVFSDRFPLTEEEAEDQWSLVRHGGGHRMGHKLIGYMDEREARADRWHGAIRDWKGPLQLGWGMRDPVARNAVLMAVRRLRPSASLMEWTELGHYPQLEDPETVADTLEDALEKLP